MHSANKGSDFLKTLQSILIEQHLTQTKLCNELKISEAQMSLLINGKRRMSIDIAAKIAMRLKISIDDIFEALNFAKSNVKDKEKSA